jgi:tRNA(adenine34) deaminase
MEIILSTNDIKYMNKAITFARKALNRGDFPVGCVITHNGEIIATGERTGTFENTTNELDHAEINALRKLGKLKGHKTINPHTITLYCTLEPCLMCFSAIMIHGISRVVYAFEDAMGGGTNLDRTNLKPLYRDHSIEIISGICRSESLGLFKSFFSDPNNRYLNDTYLAHYVREQEM